MIEHFKAVADSLLRKHYGVDLFDTELADDRVVSSLVAKGHRPFQAVNAHARRTALGRIDRPLWREDFSRAPLISDDEEAVLPTVGAELKHPCAA